jgi:GTP cyclohydrolase I
MTIRTNGIDEYVDKRSYQDPVSLIDDRLPDYEVIADKDRIAAINHMTFALKYLGVDVQSDDVKETPRRFVDALIQMTTPKSFAFTTFESDYPQARSGHFGDSGIVLVKDIPFVSLCEHHLFPFEGTGQIAYIPQGKIVGLSKLSRTLTYFASGLQVQERLGQQVADFINDELSPIGVAVILKASHSCMSLRGAKAHGATTVTSCLRGAFYSDATARAELEMLLKI